MASIIPFFNSTPAPAAAPVAKAKTVVSTNSKKQGMVTQVMSKASSAIGTAWEYAKTVPAGIQKAVTPYMNKKTAYATAVAGIGVGIYSLYEYMKPVEHGYIYRASFGMIGS